MRPLELAGRRFGRLVVMEPTSKRYFSYRVWRCICDCGKIAEVASAKLKNGHTKSCGCAKIRWGNRHAWKGGRIRNADGYVMRRSVGHPAARMPGHYVFEHRLVMEAVLGRYMVDGETVHHRNGVRDDNRPENLELWVSSQPIGQRPEDLVRWANEILDRYGPRVLYSVRGIA